MDPGPRKKETYTYGDYVTWPEEERWELIDGEPYDMTPAPLRRHQAISIELAAQVRNYLADQPCRGYAAPFDVRLPRGDEADEFVATVVQPDLVVVCDPAKLDEKGCRGAPDFVVEIISPTTAAKDQIRKTALYEKHGVREYWIIDPVHQLVIVRRLGPDGGYAPPVFHEGKGGLAVEVLAGLIIDLDLLFAAW